MLFRQNLKSAGGVLRNVGSDDRAELRQIYAQGLPRTADRRTSGDSSRSDGWRKNRTPDRTPQWGREKKARISCGILVEAGGIEPPSEDRQTMATTRLVRDFELADRPPTDGLPISQPV